MCYVFWRRGSLLFWAAEFCLNGYVLIRGVILPCQNPLRKTWFRGTRPLCYEIGAGYQEHISRKSWLLHFRFGSFRIISRIYSSTLYWKKASPNWWRKYSNKTVLRAAEICVRIWKIETILHLIYGNRLDCLHHISQILNEFNGFRLNILAGRKPHKYWVLLHDLVHVISLQSPINWSGKQQKQEQSS